MKKTPEQFWKEEWTKEYIERQKIESDVAVIGVLFIIFFWATVIISLIHFL